MQELRKKSSQHQRLQQEREQEDCWGLIVGVSQEVVRLTSKVQRDVQGTCFIAVKDHEEAKKSPRFPKWISHKYFPPTLNEALCHHEISH